MLELFVVCLLVAGASAMVFGVLWLGRWAYRWLMRTADAPQPQPQPPIPSPMPSPMPAQANDPIKELAELLKQQRPATADDIAKAVMANYKPAEPPPPPEAPKPEPIPLGYMARIAAIVGKSMDGLAKMTCDDPLLTARQSCLYGIISSAQNRHGHVIERAFLEALTDNPRFVVWSEPKFEVSHLVDSAFVGGNEEALRQTTMPYATGEKNRTVQVDLIVFDKKTSVISAYEIKRGNSASFSSYANRQNSNDLLAVQMLLQSYAAQTKEIFAAKAESFFISYYGAELQKDRGPTLKRDDLDKHFGFGITRMIDAATDEFRHRLQMILDPTNIAPLPVSPKPNGHDPATGRFTNGHAQPEAVA